MPAAGGASSSGGGGGAGGDRGAGAPRSGGAKKKTAREGAPKGVEKKAAKAPVRAVKEKVAVAKEKSGDRTAEKNVSMAKTQKRAAKGLDE
jgi:hypothetical protein